jgi:putative intracellular protease/amidase
MPSIVLVLTGADQWTLNDGTSHPTGFWAEELVEPMRVFRDAGVDVTVASPGGVRPTVDQGSLSAATLGGEDQAAEMADALEALAEILASPMPLEDVVADDFDGVFIPGGHGPMEDLATSEDLGRLLVSMLDDDRVIGAVCHGPAGMLSAMRPDGTWAFADRELAGFTNQEETQAGLADRAPWLLEDRIRQEGGAMRTGPAWEPFSVVDDNVVTGQNPASSGEVAQKTVEAMEQRSHRVHVVPWKGEWAYEHEHSEPEAKFRTQREAIKAAKDHARSHGDWEVIIHNRKGRIRDSVTMDRAHEGRARDRVH